MLGTSMEISGDESSNNRSNPECLSDNGSRKQKEHTEFKEIHPRVGDKYQSVIPPITNSAADHARWRYYSTGLPVPVVWTMCEKAKAKDEPEVKQAVINDGTIVLALPCAEAVLCRTNPNRSEFRNLAERVKCVLPGSLAETLTDLERKSFLLGLLIFGKNFALVQRFVDSKKMGDLLYFYYERFKMFPVYRKWLASQKKSETKKPFALGQQIFRGWRRHKLQSRLYPCIPQESKTLLPELLQSLGQEEKEFLRNVFALKNIVGLKMLINAVGIGSGKYDLTIRTTKKDYSRLTAAEIINLLTRERRLSKARADGIFEDAVWPLLLKRGWTSEQPEYLEGSSSSRSLVFLKPGVHKFLRSQQVKGDHYFDSVSDVLNKVASDPSLLKEEIEAEEINEGEEEIGGCQPMEESDNDNAKTVPLSLIAELNKSESHIMSDLNQPNASSNLNIRQPQLLTDFETREPSLMPRVSTSETNEDEKPKLRQSTRNRPPSTKAVEACASGYYNTPQKKMKVSKVPKYSRGVSGRGGCRAASTTGTSSNADNSD